MTGTEPYGAARLTRIVDAEDDIVPEVGTPPLYPMPTAIVL